MSWQMTKVKERREESLLSLLAASKMGRREFFLGAFLRTTTDPMHSSMYSSVESEGRERERERRGLNKTPQFSAHGKKIPIALSLSLSFPPPLTLSNTTQTLSRALYFLILSSLPLSSVFMLFSLRTTLPVSNSVEGCLTIEPEELDKEGGGVERLINKRKF